MEKEDCRESLWDFAKNRLSKAEQKFLEFDDDDKAVGSNVVKQLEATTKHALDLCKSKRWTIKRPGKEKEPIIVRDLFGKVINWIDIFKQVGDQIVQYDPGYAALPWAGARFLIQIAINDFKKFDFVVTGAEKIVRMATTFEIFEYYYLRRFTIATKKLQSALVSLYESILRYLSQANRYFNEKRGVRVFKSGLLAQNDFEELQNDIDVAEREVDRCAQLIKMEIGDDLADQINELSISEKRSHATLEDALKAMKQPISRISYQFDQFQYNLDRTQRIKILNWLSSQPYAEHHDRIKNKVLRGTGQWLLQHPKFTSLVDESSNSLLWLYGMHGTGKSCLASIVIDDQVEKYNKGQSPQPLYFYCSRTGTDPGTSDVREILGSIARQLSCRSLDSPIFSKTKELYEYRQLHGYSSDSKLSAEKCCDLIVELTEQYPLSFIVIDALDECDRETRLELITHLENILEHSTGLVKVLVTSREEGDLLHCIKSHNNINVTQKENGLDIRDFVNDQTEKLVKGGKLIFSRSSAGQKFKDDVKTEITRQSEGMFRWAGMRLQALKDCRLERSIRKKVFESTPSLTQLYDSLYERMISIGDEYEQNIFMNVLKWLLCARQRLKGKEFLKAVTFTVNLSFEEIHESIISDLSNFVTCNTDEDGEQDFHFAHYSVKEYLMKRSEYLLEPCHAFAAETTLITLIGSTDSPDAQSFLSELQLESPYDTLRGTELYERSVFDYSLRFWYYHSRLAGQERRVNETRFKKLFEYFLSSGSDQSGPLHTWLISRRRKKMDTQAGFHLRKLIQNYAQSPLIVFFLSCVFDFPEIVQRCIQEQLIETDLQQEGLILAASWGSRDLFKLLLGPDGKAKVNESFIIEYLSSGAEVGTLEWLLGLIEPSQITKEVILRANRDDGRVIALLLDHNPEIKITEHLIQECSWGASQGAIEVLLSRAKTPSITSSGLSSAARWGDIGVLKALLRYADDSSIITSDILGQAAYSGSIEILQTLLDRAPDIEITEEAMMSAVECRGDSRTVKMLIDHGGNVTEDVVRRAASWGGSTVFKLLLDEGCQVTSETLALGSGNCIDGAAIVKLQLRATDNSITNEDWISMMSKCAQNTHEGPHVIKVLLKVKPDLKVPEEVFLAMSDNGISDNQILAAILNDGREVELTDVALESLLKNLDFTEVVPKLLSRCSIKIVTNQMMLGAVSNDRFGDEMTKALLEIQDNMESPSEAVIEAAVRNGHSGHRIIQLLEAKFGRFTFSDAIVEAAAESTSLPITKYVFDRHPTKEIDMSLLLKTASKGGFEVMRFLLDRSQTKVIDELAVAAAGNVDCGKEMLRFLLDREPSIQVCSEMFENAASCSYSGLETLSFLVSRASNIKIRVSVLKAALESDLTFGDVVGILLRSHLQVEFDDEIIEGAVKLGSSSALELFLEHGVSINPSQEMIRNCVRNSNVLSLKLLLGLAGSAKLISRDIVQLATENGDKEIIQLIERSN